MDNINLNIENHRPHCPVIDVNGFISDGKQFDLDITLPEDTRDVIYGKIKMVCYNILHKGLYLHKYGREIAYGNQSV